MSANRKRVIIITVAMLMVGTWRIGAEENKKGIGIWKVGIPIVTYYAGPEMSEAVAKQMAEGGFNVVWCREKDLGLLRKHGLRGMLHDVLLTPETLDIKEKKRQLDVLIERVRKHPAFYSYYITDEPKASQFPALGRLVAYLKERDPGHMAYINLFSTYVSNEQLGTKGSVAAAYREYLRQYISIVKPTLLSYDHYQFNANGDGDQYFLNLAMIRRASQEAGIPFLNIVQACSWSSGVRVPNADEMRYLVYTTAAYGAQGISYYVYTASGHNGGIARADGTATPIYDTLKILNREFVAVVSQLQSFRSLGIYHTAMKEAGCIPLPQDFPFRLNVLPSVQLGRGMMLGCFGRGDKPTHVLVVNLDYDFPVETTLTGPENLDVFDAGTRTWIAKKSSNVKLHLLPGGGVLVRLAQ